MTSKNMTMRYGWYDIKEYDHVVSLKFNKEGTDGMASNDMTL